MNVDENGLSIPFDTGNKLTITRFLQKVALESNNRKQGFDRFTLWSTVFQILRIPHFRPLLEKKKINEIMDYVRLYTCAYPVPRHEAILHHLGFLLLSKPNEIIIFRKDNKDVKFRLADDELSSGVDLLKMAVIVAASKHDREEYRVDYTAENRKILFDKYIKDNGLDYSYEDYITGKKNFDLNDEEVIDAFDENDELCLDNIPGTSFRIEEAVNLDELKSILALDRIKGRKFSVKIKNSVMKNRAMEELDIPGFKHEREGVFSTFTPVFDLPLAPGPEHTDLLEELIDFIMDNASPVNKYVEKPPVKKTYLPARQDFSNLDYKRETTEEDAKKTIQDLIKGDKNLEAKYALIKCDFEENRQLMQSKRAQYDEFRDREFDKPKAWPKLTTKVIDRIEGKLFEEMLINMKDLFREHLNSTPYRAAIATGNRKDCSSYSDAELIGVALDNIVSSPPLYPPMRTTMRGRVFLSKGSKMVTTESQSENWADDEEI